MTFQRVFVGSVLALLVMAPTVAAADGPIRIGASLSQTGSFASLGQNQLRGYQLCVKHANDKGGVLGRKLELIVEDDESKGPTAAAIYEKLITQTKVDAVLGPYSSTITEAVAAVNEKYRMPMVAPLASTTSIFKKGRKFVFMVQSPAEAYFEGFVDIAVRHGLRTIAVVNEDTLFPKASAIGTVELARKRNLNVVLAESYPKGTSDFGALLGRVKASNAEALAAATYFEDAVAITRQLKDANASPKMFGLSVGADLPKFHERLGRTAEFVYGASQWEPELVTLRAGGLIPIARQYPGAKDFVDSYHREFRNADLSYHSAGGYAGCQVLLEGIRRSNSLDGDSIRAAILKLDVNTVYGGFKVDADGFQSAHKMLMFQWQDGKKVIVWPDEIAPGKPIFPTPPWNQR